MFATPARLIRLAPTLIVAASLVAADATAPPPVHATASAAAHAATITNVDSSTNPEVCNNEQVCCICILNLVQRVGGIGNIPYNSGVAEDYRYCLDEARARVSDQRSAGPHAASDYQPTTGGAPGCGTCSGSPSGSLTDPAGLGAITMPRLHRMREVSFRSNLGPGVFTGYDAHLTFTATNSASGQLRCVDFFDPRLEPVVRFTPSGTPGIFTDSWLNTKKELRLYTAYDVATGQGVLAQATTPYNQISHAVVVDHYDGLMIFEAIDVYVDPSPTEEVRQVPGPDTTLVALPSGQITGMGFYISRVRGNHRMDNLTLLGAGGEVRYREVFPLGAGGGTNATQEGWTGVRGGRSTAQQASIYSGGDPGAETPVASFPFNTGTGGNLFWSPQIAGVFLYTTETQGISTADVAQITWQTRNNNATDQQCIAVCVDGVWYTTNQAATHTAGSTTWQNQAVALAGTHWRRHQVELVDDNVERAGRLVRQQASTGYGTTISYQHQNGELPAAGDRLWQIDRITDPYGNQVAVTYGATQVNGGWVISSLNLPTGGTVSYTYTDGRLSAISYPDGTQSTFTYTWEPSRNLLRIDYADAGAEGLWRNYSVRYTGAYAVGAGISASAYGIVPSSCQLTRAVFNGDGEPVYANLNTVANTTTYHNGGLEVLDWSQWPTTMTKADATSWSLSTPSGQAPSTSQLTRTLESGKRVDTYASWTAWRYGQYASQNDGTGVVTTYTGWTPGLRPTGILHPDGSTETWTYNARNQPTSYTDQLGRVTTWTYDAWGNRLSETVAVGTPAEATRTWTYYDESSPNRRLVATMTDERGNVTRYLYDANHRLTTVIQPSDDPATPDAQRPRMTYTYTTAGLPDVTTVSGSQLAPGNIPVPIATGHTWDLRGRVVTTTYADLSTETQTWGGGQDANLVVARTDRNGRLTTLGYDRSGRRIRTEIAAGTPDAVVERCVYFIGTDIEQWCDRGGDVVSYLLDHRLRRVATTVQPRVGAILTSTTTYGSDNRVSAQTDPYGRRTLFLYDVRGRTDRVIRELVPGGVPAGANLRTLARVTTANPPYVIEDTLFDVASQVTSRTDGRGISTSYTYDARGRMTAQTEAAGSGEAATTGWVYDLAGNRTSQTSPRGIVTAWTYTGRNLVASLTEAVGTPVAATTTMTYTASGKLRTSTDALARVTTYTYGTCCDRLVVVTDADGFETHFTYDPVGNRLSVTDANLLTTATGYDARNRVKTVTNARGEITTYTYRDDATLLPGAQIAGLSLGAGANGSAVQVTDPLGHTVTEIRDGAGRTVRRIDAEGNATTIAYDSVVAGLVATASTDPLGHTTTAQADGAGRVRRQIDAIGAVSTAGFDANGNQVSSRSAPTAADPNGIGWNAQYDARNRITYRASTRGDASSDLAWTYDLDGNRLTETDALDQVETSVYDARDRRIQLTDRVGGITRFAYDAVGNLVQISDADNELVGGLANVAGTTQYAYNARNLLVAEAFPQGQQGRTLRVYTYDGGRRLTQRQVGVLSGAFSATATPGAPVTTTGYAYDAANRLTTRSYADGANDGFAYDAAGRLTAATSARYATAVARAYDAANRLTSESLAIDGQSYPVGYSYNADSTISGMTYPQTGSLVGRTYTDRHELATVARNGATLNGRTYDAAGRLTSQQWGGLATLTETRTYLAADYAVASIAVPGVTGFGYVYDAVGRKTSETSTLAGNQGFGYDTAGRLTSWNGAISQTWTLSKVGDWQSTTRDGVPEARTNSAVHEALTVGAAALTYDIQGNLTQDEQGRLLSWDPENRLSAASVPGGASYRYDALGRRVAKRVGDLTTYYLPAGAQTVVEIDRLGVRPPTAQTGSEADGTLANLAATPVGGGILAPPAPGSDVTRVNFQPAGVAIPAGFLADSGRTSAARTNGLTYGWTADRSAGGVYHPNAVPRPAYTTGIRMGAEAWSLAVPAGRYAVAVVAGDALSTALTNNLVIGGTPVTDGSPATEPAYEAGNFDGYLQVVTLTGAGSISIAPGVDALDPTLCFVEIVAIPAGLADEAAWLAAQQASLSAAVDAMNTATMTPGASTDVVREYIYGSYVDEVVAYRRIQGTTSSVYYPHYNHLYSVAAVTDGAGVVVERFTYDAYGRQTAAVTAGQTASGFGRGFTGYVTDNETGLLHARARLYSPGLGRFVGRDEMGYIDGMSLYASYFAVNSLDPFGYNEGPWHGGGALGSALDCCIAEAMAAGEDLPTNYDGRLGPKMQKCFDDFVNGGGGPPPGLPKNDPPEGWDAPEEPGGPRPPPGHAPQKPNFWCLIAGPTLCPDPWWDYNSQQIGQAYLNGQELHKELLYEIASGGSTLFAGMAAEAGVPEGALVYVRGGVEVYRAVRTGGGSLVLQAAKRGRKPLPALDSTGKVHGELPTPGDLKNYSKEDLASLRDELKQSVQERIRKTSELGSDRPHGQRQGAEQALIHSINSLLGN